MRKLQIEDAEVMRIAIQQKIGRSEESHYDHRLHGLLLVTAGQSCREVAELFGENGTTVQSWASRFEQGGLDALREGERAGRPRTLDAKDWRRLQADLRKTPRDFDLAVTLWDGPVLSEHLRRSYGVDLGVRQCQRLFRQMGFRLRKPRPQVAQSDPLKVAAVKKLRRLARRPNVELWNLDECHFQQHGSRCRMWVPPEIKDPILQHAPTRKSVACFGAVSLSTGKFVRMMCPIFNAVTFESFLKRLLRQQTPGRRMIVVLDNARYHHAILLTPFLRRHSQQLRLLFLPPYSPQLAPIERVWKLTRRLATHNRYFATLPAVLTAVNACFNRWRRPNNVLRRLCCIT